MPVFKNSDPFARAGELLAFSIAIGIVNIFVPGNPGFLSGFFNPYVTLALIVAAYYGKYYGFLSLGLSALIVGLGLPAAESLLASGRLGFPDVLRQVLRIAPVPLAVAIVETYLLGLVRDSLTRKDRDAGERLRIMSREKGLALRQVRALSGVNRELEERISQQENSITSLYSQIEVLNSLNLEKALKAILEMARRFVGASRCSIWEHRAEAGRLERVAQLGDEDAAEIRSAIPDDTTIEGWVVRNNLVFSVRMLLENEALARLESGRNIITLPITAGHRIWGVLNIEEMPFARYNLYTERLLLMIMALAGPALERAIEYESLIRQEDINPVTGLPSFAQFYTLLERERARLAVEPGTLAVLVLEVLNFPALAAEHGRDPALGLLSEVSALLLDLSAGRARVFHYKAETQLVLLYPSLDADGVSLFSLTLLGRLNAKEWKLRDVGVRLEVILGFAVLSGHEQSSDDLLEAAGNLLEMQKV
jgi:GGDEF domain-containing protein